jgi:glycosyltransferase involved in cell wall biosynthesis
MRVLITNTRLDGRGGAESFVKDLARGLQSRGHSVLGYSSDPVHRERLLENDVIPVAANLEDLPFSPDIIHAQHHLDAMTAITALPGVPAIYHCHGAVWRECAPKHPRIYKYLAVTRTLAERMVIESNINPAGIEVLLNGVDLKRFTTVRTPPPRPTRAAFFNSRHEQNSETVSAVTDAARKKGLDLEFFGMGFGVMMPAPEKTLPVYDIVFASGRSAIEALACGCAVVTLGRTSCGELVRSGNFDRLRQANFAIAVNSPPPSADRIAAELDGFSPEDCAAVTRRLRAEASFEGTIDTLLPLYDEVIARHRTAELNLQDEVLATSRYLRKIVPLIKQTDRMLDGQWSSPTRATSFDELRAQLALLQQQIERVE